MLLHSSRRLDDIIYRQELDAIGCADPSLRIVHTLTRERPEGWTGHSGRIDDALLTMTCFPSDQNPRSYVCGPTASGMTSPSHAAPAQLRMSLPGTDEFGGSFGAWDKKTPRDRRTMRSRSPLSKSLSAA